MKLNFIKKNALTFFVFLFGLTIFNTFASIHINEFITVDEPRWIYTRIPNFCRAIKNLEMENTMVSDKPGVTNGYLGCVSMYINQSYGENGVLEFENQIFVWRILNLLTISIILTFIYFYLLKLFEKKIAYLSFLLIATNPILIGISQIINPDTLLWGFSFLSFLSFVLFFKNKKNYSLLTAGISLGLALASKYFAVILFFLTGIYIYLEIVINNLSKEKIKDIFINYLKYIFIGLYTFFVLYPYLWIHPIEILKATIFSKLLLIGIPIFSIISIVVLVDILLLNKKYHLKAIEILSKYRKYINFILLIPISLLLLNILLNYRFFDPQEYAWFINVKRNGYFFHLIPFSGYVILFSFPIAILISLIALIFKKFKSSFYNKLTINVFVGLLIFIIGPAISKYKLDIRYLVLFIPFLLLASTFILIEIKSKLIIYFIIFALFLNTFLATFSTSPFYMQYKNILNNKNAVMYDAWGMGGYEVAKFANSYFKYNLHNNLIWVDREGFMDFYKGEKLFRSTPFTYQSFLDNVDYMVISAGGERYIRGILRNGSLTFENRYLQDIYNNIYQNKEYLKENTIYKFCINSEFDCVKLIRVVK